MATEGAAEHREVVNHLCALRPPLFHQVAGVRQLNRIAVRAAISGRRSRFAASAGIVGDRHRIPRRVRIIDRGTIIEGVPLAVQLSAAHEWSFDRSRLQGVDARQRPSAKSCSRSPLCDRKCYSRHEMSLSAIAYSYLVNN